MTPLSLSSTEEPMGYISAITIPEMRPGLKKVCDTEWMRNMMDHFSDTTSFLSINCTECWMLILKTKLATTNRKQTKTWKTNDNLPGYDDCLEVRGEIIRTVLCCIVYWKLCAVISTPRWAVLTVLWIGFCLTGPISLCVNSCVYVFFALYCLTAYVLYYCKRWGGPGKIEA